MRRFLTSAVIVLIFVSVGASSANAAIIWNNGVNVQSTTNVTVSNPNNAASTPDGNRMALNGNTSTPKIVVVRFSFSGLGLAATNATYRVVTDGWFKSWSATVSAINGTSVTSGTVSNSGTSTVQDFVTYLPANTSSFSPGTALTSIDITFTLTGAIRGSILVDTVGTPEPATLLLFGLGLVGVGSWSYSKRKRKQRSRVA